MYPEFANKFWEHLKLAYNLCEDSQNVRVHDMRNYMMNNMKDNMKDNTEMNMNYLIDNSDYGSSTSKKASDADNIDSGNYSINDVSTLRTDMEVTHVGKQNNASRTVVLDCPTFYVCIYFQSRFDKMESRLERLENLVINLVDKVEDVLETK